MRTPRELSVTIHFQENQFLWTNRLKGRTSKGIHIPPLPIGQLRLRSIQWHPISPHAYDTKISEQAFKPLSCQERKLSVLSIPVSIIWNGIRIFIWNLRTSHLLITACLGNTIYSKTLEHSTASNSSHSWYLHCLCIECLRTLTVGRAAAGFLDIKSYKRSNFPSYDSFFFISLVRSFALYTTCKMNSAFNIRLRCFSQMPWRSVSMWN